MMTVIFVIFVNCERTVLFSVKRDLDPPFTTLLVVWMFCRTKTSKNSRLQRPIENLFFPFIQIVKYCMVIWPLMRAMGEGRLLEVGACTRKYGELSLSVLVFRSFSMCWLK